jgi:transposase InsO family protein
MTTKTKIARRKLSLLQLATDLNNVSKACKLIGYSRQQFYEIRRNYQTYGSQGLLDRIPGPKNPHPNRVSTEVEKAILDYCLDEPTHGPVRVAQQLVLKNIQVSSGGVKGVWSRHTLLSKHDRLLRLEKTMHKQAFKLSDKQIRLLERFNPEFRERHIHAPFSGYLVAVDTFLVGSLKGIGRIYLQSALDCHSRFVWGRLYNSKLPVTAVHVLNHDAIPFFEKHNASIQTILSDNGREYCGRPDNHPYEIFLQLEGIEHRTTKVKRPQSNGFIERFNRTILDEHFRIQGRKKFYETIDQMQKDLDIYLQLYNYERSHQGRNMHGRTPHQVFKEGLSKIKKSVKTSKQQAA